MFGGHKTAAAALQSDMQLQARRLVGSSGIVNSE